MRERKISIEEMAEVLIEAVNQTDPQAVRLTATETLELASKAAHTMMDKAFNAEPSQENKKKFRFYQLVAGELHRKISGF